MLCLYFFFSLQFCFIFRVCFGFLNPNLEGRIVKGFKIDIDYYPHSVFLHFQKYIPTACGSSLIMDRAVVTAAHCLDELKYHGGRISAFFGSTIPLHSGVVRHVVAYRIHPKFNAQKGRFNLGIAFLNERVPLGKNIQKIPIAVKTPQPNDPLYTSGWGKQVPKKLPDYSDLRHLKASKQRVISVRDCQQYSGYRMSSAYWCTVSINGHHYQGDAGNGLVTGDGFLVGVVSFMINEVTIYSDVTREKPWIQKSLLSLMDEVCRQ